MSSTPDRVKLFILHHNKDTKLWELNDPELGEAETIAMRSCKHCHLNDSLVHEKHPNIYACFFCGKSLYSTSGFSPAMER